MISADAAAKINLSLHVTGRRADGYHTLSGLVMFADLADRLEAQLAAELRLEVRGPFAHELAGSVVDDNLVIKAARALAGYAGLAGGAQIILHKMIPTGAGLGGGSADAAATLRLLLLLWNLSIDTVTLQSLALGLGADVPMCLQRVPVLVGGIGEELAPVGPICDCPAVLVRGSAGLATAGVFSKYTIDKTEFSSPVAAPAALTSPEEVAKYLNQSHHDLEQAAFSLEPEVVMVQHALAQQKDCLLARMSGSGAACFGLFRTRQSAKQAAITLQKEQPSWWVQDVVLKGADMWRPDGYSS